MASRIQRRSRKKKAEARKESRDLQAYGDPKKPGCIVWVSVLRFARHYGIYSTKAKRILGKDLTYILHRPRRRRRFATLPVLVFYLRVMMQPANIRSAVERVSIIGSCTF